MHGRTLDSGAQEALKWLAILCMVIDHCALVLYDRTLPYATEIGRLAMPLFTLLLAYNLARPGAWERGVPPRTFRRLLVFGVISFVPHLLAFGAPYFNVMFSLALIVGVAILVREGSKPALILALALFVIAGSRVEYVWFGAGLGIAAWFFFTDPRAWKAALALFMLLGLCQLNGNLWAMLAIPLMAAGFFVRIPAPRSSWYSFYAIYPAHLAALVAIRAAL